MLSTICRFALVSASFCTDLLLYSQCEVQDSVSYHFTSSTITVRSFPGSSFLPRTNSGSISTVMYSEGRSANSSFAASSTTVFSGAPAKNNVFFGGDDATNGHANTQVIGKTTYNLFSGPIKIRGTFYNRSSDPNYNESYVGIVPANYNYFAPLDADPGMSGSGLSTREGIIIGAVNGSGNAFLIDHKNSGQLSGFIKGPVSSGVNFSKWYTMEAVFEVVNNQLFLKSAVYNDGTVRKPLGNNVLIGNVSNFSWLDSVTLITGVDDMLADVTVVKYKCEGCVTADSVVYDLRKSTTTRIPTPSAGSVSVPDYAGYKTPLVIETMASNDSMFANSNQCLNPSGNRSTVYFGGDVPSPGAQHAACISTRLTYNILEGPLTIQADFYNRQDVPNYNELYFMIVPPDFTWYKPWISGSVTEFEGIRIGGRPFASLVVDAGTGTDPDMIVRSLSNHNKASNGQWFRARATFDTFGGKLRLSNFEINNGSGFSKVYSSPVEIGNVSKYNWLNRARVQVFADDMVDSIGIKKVLCTKIKKEDCLIAKKNDTLCRGNDSFNVNGLFKINGVDPVGASYKIVAFNNQRNHSNVSLYSLVSGYKMLTSWPSGIWQIKIISNCGAEDSAFVRIKNEPDIRIYSKSQVIVCSDSFKAAESILIDSVNVRGGIWQWSGDFILSGLLKPVKNSVSLISKGFIAKGIYYSPEGCTDSLTFPFSVRNANRVERLDLSDNKVCDGDSFTINAVFSPLSSKLIWSKMNSADGRLSVLSNNRISYLNGNIDAQNGNVKLRMSFDQLANDPCPEVSDTVSVQIVKYPVPAISDSVRLCAPAAGSISGLEMSGKNPTDLRFNWQTPAGTRQSGSNLVFDYPLQGKADAYFTVTDTNGPCSAAILKPSWIQVYPRPVALFEPDPNDYRMIPGATFRFRNLSVLDQTLFPGSISSWQWDLLGLRHQDFSNIKEPVFSVPDDTAAYLVRLITASDKGCRDTMLSKVFAISKFEVFMPTSFSPDGEGNAANNFYMVSAFNFRSLKLKIYSRWGEKLFETTSVKNGWDGMYMGSECQEGVYVAIAEVKDMAGYTHLYKQTFHLLR